MSNDSCTAAPAVAQAAGNSAQAARQLHSRHKQEADAGGARDRMLTKAQQQHQRVVDAPGVHLRVLRVVQLVQEGVYLHPQLRQVNVLARLT